MLPVESPFKNYTGLDGKPLENGYVYFGEPDQDPITHPVTVYWDAAGTLPAAQPLRTVGGYIMNAGSPANIFYDGAYSELVKDSKDRQVFYAPTSNEFSIAALVLGLAKDIGASLVGYIAAGTGAIKMTVREKLLQIVSRAEYDTDANFNIAKAGKPNIDGAGRFDATVRPNDESVDIALSAALTPVASAGRGRVCYRTATSVYVTAPRNIIMGGFRFMGQYLRGRAPVVPSPASGQQVVSMATDLAAESLGHIDGWYAVFSCANPGDATCSFKLVPFLRVGSIVDSTVTLCSAKEVIHANTPTSYAWRQDNNMAGTDCLVITESIDGHSNTFSGRVTKLVGNTAQTVTLEAAGTIGPDDWLLPAPAGYSHYCYHGAFYWEAPGDVRNIADSGNLVKAKMNACGDPNFVADGAIADPVKLRFGGYISPLAAGVVLKETTSLSTASTGDYAAYFDHDSGHHTVQTLYFAKEAAATLTVLEDDIVVPFSFGQNLYYSNAGSLAPTRAGGKLEITGWIEP